MPFRQFAVSVKACPERRTRSPTRFVGVCSVKFENPLVFVTMTPTTVCLVYAIFLRTPWKPVLPEIGYQLLKI